MAGKQAMVEVAQAVRQACRSEEYREYFADLLLRLCSIDTTAGRDPKQAAAAETACLSLIAAEAARYLPAGACFEKRPIDLRITSLPDFTKPPPPYTPEEYFAGRSNLIVSVPGSPRAGIPMIYNAHIDTVAPFVPPRRKGLWIYGRGTADDKGQVALLLTCLRLLKSLEEKLRLKVQAPRVYQFVIEEETGGNGTLSALLDDRIRSFSALVLEITSLEVFPANRGAVWYQAELRRVDPKVRFAELAAFVILALEEEGAAIKEESKHPLFKPHHVQTCHGILGSYGKHPSAVNDYVAFRVVGLERRTAEELAAGAVAAYCRRYGDKTRELDPETGKPLVECHMRLTENGASGAILLEVFGKAGHMGAIHKLDCALIKAAYIVKALFEAGGRVELAEGADGDTVMLEGGQGFVPTHGIEEIQERLRAAAQKGAALYLERLGIMGVREPGKVVEVYYEKLHNDAFAGRLHCPLLKAMEASWRLAGRRWPPLRGWDVSCDARLFHRFGHDVVVWGPGQLSRAHAPDEAISLSEAMEALELLSLTTLKTGGSL